MRTLWLWGECVLLFVIAPVVVGLTLRQLPWLWVLGGITLGAGLWLWRRGEFSAKQFWSGPDSQTEWRQLKQILWRFSFCAAGLLSLTLLLFPEKLFALPRTMPLQWLVLLATYPALSVYPQELLYRAFFARRYRALFRRAEAMLLASALLFGWLHVIFQNPLAVLLTLVGGWFFAETYARTRSLRLVCLEHTLYGSLIFSVGLGEFFLQSALTR
jgi:hypothetical protein